MIGPHQLSLLNITQSRSIRFNAGVRFPILLSPKIGLTEIQQIAKVADVSNQKFSHNSDSELSNGILYRIKFHVFTTKKQ